MVTIDLTKDEVCKFLKTKEVLTIMDLLQDQENVLIAKMVKTNNDIHVSAVVMDSGDAKSEFLLFSATAKVELIDYTMKLRNELRECAKIPGEKEEEIKS